MGEQALNIERPGNKNKNPPRGLSQSWGALITIMGGGISMTAGGSIMGLQVITLSPPFFLTWHLAHLVYFVYLAHLVYLVYLVPAGIIPGYLAISRPGPGIPGRRD